LNPSDNIAFEVTLQDDLRSDGQVSEVQKSSQGIRMISRSHEFILHSLVDSNYRFNPLLVKGRFKSAKHRSIQIPKLLDNKKAGQSPSMGLQNKADTESAKKSLIRDYFESVCREYYSKNKLKEQQVIEENTHFNTHPQCEVQVNFSNPRETLTSSKESSDVSKSLIKYLQSATQEQISPYISLIVEDMSNCLKKINTCYVIKHLIKVDAKFKDRAAEACASELEDLLGYQHSCRVIYTLCNNSDLFREFLLFYFKTKLNKVIATLPGAVLLSLLIQNIQEEEKHSFIFEALEEDNELIRAEFFGRAFATYMNKCSVQKLEEITRIFARFVHSMLHNNYGNYLLQIFYERGCKVGKKMCEDALRKIYKKAFVRKYSRFVLLKAISCDETGEFTQNMTDLVFQDQPVVISIVQKKLSSVILLLCLAKLERSPRLPKYLAQLRYLKPKLITSKFNVAALEFYKDLRKIESALQAKDVCF
jgi:hypothetical protein